MGRSKVAFVTGISGQDGAYLSKLLLQKGYRVVGGLRRNASGSLWRLEELGIRGDVETVPFELLEQPLMMRTLERVKPDEIYSLAAQSFVGVSFEEPIHTCNVTGMGVVRLLESVRTVCPSARFYQASSSEMFGNTGGLLNEQSPMAPRSPYGFAKLFAYWAVRNYREAFGLHASNGILFNHESPLRGLDFVTRKITDGVARIACGHAHVIKLGNLDAKRDWGFAGDFIEAMWLMLQQDKADDYVVATGETHSVTSFLFESMKAAGLGDPFGQGEAARAITGEHAMVFGSGPHGMKKIASIDPTLYRPAEVDVLLGDASKARRVLGWAPKTTFKELVAMMVEADMRRHGETTIQAARAAS